MTLNRGAQRAIIASYFAVLVALYAMAWFLPAIGLFQDDAGFLVTARAIAAGHGYVIDSLPHPIPQTQLPPLFPALLALWGAVSQHALWLKLLPLACAAGWLTLTRSLLLKMGASRNGSLLLVALAAASPTVIFISTNLLPETLFAFLVTVTLLTLLEEKAFAAGAFAGLATLTEASGLALIAACIFTLAVRRRFRSAAVFALVAIVITAPWLGWSLAHATHDAVKTEGSHLASNIFTGLAASEKLIVLSHNAVDLLASPLALVTGFSNVFSGIGAVAILLWCLFVRRQMVPDLFVGLYCLALLCFTSPPQRFLAPVLPLFLWMIWRALRLIKAREALAALVLITMVVPFWGDATGMIAAYDRGSFAADGPAPDKWNELQKLYSFIREGTPGDSVVLANMDALLFLNTGRHALRGFAADRYELYYGARRSPVTPDQLSKSIVEAQVKYLVLTPDEGLPESPSFHRSVEALQRGGVVEAAGVPGLAAGYSLFRIVQR
jgi:hypothetical protein